MKSNRLIFIIIIFASLVLTACGDDSTASKRTNLSSNTNPTSTENGNLTPVTPVIPVAPVIPSRFKAGDLVTINNIPSAKAIILNDLNTYLNNQGFKAIAIAANGYGWLSFTRQGSLANPVSQMEANRMALEACQIASNNQACAIFAEGNFVFYDDGIFQASMTPGSIDLTNSVVSAANFPFVSENIRDSNIPSVLNLSSSSAVYLDLTGGAGFSNGQANTNAAISTAKGFCESQTNEFCILYMVNNQVVLDAAGVQSFFELKVQNLALQ